MLEEKVGPVRCGVRLSGTAGFAEFDCPKLPQRAGARAPKEFLAAALGLAPTEIGFENHVPSSGRPACPIISCRSATWRRSPRRRRAARWTRAFGGDAAFLYTRETEGHDHAFRARMFAPEFGIDEDPATGSAVAAFPGAMQDFDALPDGDHAAIIEQGFEMGRPSLIRLEVTVAGGAISAVRIGGDAVRVAEGILRSDARCKALPSGARARRSASRCEMRRKPVERPRELSRASAVRFADLPLLDLAALKARTPSARPRSPS